MTSESAHVDGVHASPRCSYNVATGGKPVTIDYNEIIKMKKLLLHFIYPRISLYKHEFFSNKLKGLAE